MSKQLFQFNFKYIFPKNFIYQTNSLICLQFKNHNKDCNNQTFILLVKFHL